MDENYQPRERARRNPATRSDKWSAMVGLAITIGLVIYAYVQGPGDPRVQNEVLGVVALAVIVATVVSFVSRRRKR